jgi:hypothetical protein
MNRNPFSPVARDERGFAMAGLLLVMLMLTVVGAYSVSHTAIDTRITTHFDTGNRAFFAAESGVLHGLNAMNGPGVINFENEVVGRWDELLGTAFISLPRDVGSRYSVAVAADPTNPRDRGRIVATGTGPLQARRAIEITLGKSAVYAGPPGAIHIAADEGVASSFQGNAFEVDGNNRNRFGALANDGRVIPGISTRNDAVANGVANSLSNQQKDNVRGSGFSMNPLTPSVQPAASPGTAEMDAFVAEMLSNPTTFTTGTKSFTGNSVFGTMAAPQVTHMTNQDVGINGNASGSGILIVDGSITVNGNLDFTGLIIVRGETVINQTVSEDGETVVLGNATILGSLWTGNLSIRVGGSAIIDYCHECLQLVDTMGGQSMILPRPMAVVAWGEVL